MYYILIIDTKLRFYSEVDYFSTTPCSEVVFYTHGILADALIQSVFLLFSYFSHLYN